jgi:hypothetical protein
MPFEAKPLRLLTRPVLKFSDGTTHHVKIEGAMFIGKNIKARTPAPGEKEKEPATILNVIDLENGGEAQMIVNAVVKSVLTESYPGDTYVGKCFSITKLARAAGKAYNPFNIVEIEDPAPAAKPAPSPAHARR